eukprot:6203495-Lingulodinium_polyedra.AAC.1
MKVRQRKKVRGGRSCWPVSAARWNREQQTESSSEALELTFRANGEAHDTPTVKHYNDTR